MYKDNPHKQSYDFNTLLQVHPKLSKFTRLNPKGIQTVNFADSEAVFHLNKAILKANYGIIDWHVPKGYLIPPIPGRADYIHHLNDLCLGANFNRPLKGLDIGVGASGIYPILGSQIYNWTMVGSDIHEKAVITAKQNMSLTEGLSERVEIRHQKDHANIFKGIIHPDEFFDFTMCNPPFYDSKEEALRTTRRKHNNLKLDGPALLNFEGQANELWCNGGEALFIKRMIKQSSTFKDQVGWFTCLVSRKEHLPKITKQLEKLKTHYKIVLMSQGHKQSRFVAWTFKNEKFNKKQ